MKTRDEVVEFTLKTLYRVSKRELTESIAISELKGMVLAVLVIRIEFEFGLEIPMVRANKFRTVSELIDYVYNAITCVKRIKMGNPINNSSTLN